MAVYNLFSEEPGKIYKISKTFVYYDWIYIEEKIILDNAPQSDIFSTVYSDSSIKKQNDPPQKKKRKENMLGLFHQRSWVGSRELFQIHMKIDHTDRHVAYNYNEQPVL